MVLIEMVLSFLKRQFTSIWFCRILLVELEPCGLYIDFRGFLSDRPGQNVPCPDQKVRQFRMPGIHPMPKRPDEVLLQRCIIFPQLYLIPSLPELPQMIFRILRFFFLDYFHYPSDRIGFLRMPVWIIETELRRCLTLRFTAKLARKWDHAVTILSQPYGTGIAVSICGDTQDHQGVFCAASGA